MTDIIKFIKPDKRGHFLIGSILMWVLMAVWIKFEPHFLWLVGAHLLLSYGKEFGYDLWLGKGNFEWLDGHFTFSPMVAQWAILYALGFDVWIDALLKVLL